MASKLGTAPVNSLLGLQYGGTSYTPPTTLYVALFTSAPTDFGVGTGGTEVTGGSYARVAVTNNTTNFPAPNARSVANGTAVSFVTPTASWGTVTAFGYYSAATGGTWQGGGDLTASQTISSGNTVSFGIGALTVSLP